jgi:hypothetical protein
MQTNLGGNFMLFRQTGRARAYGVTPNQRNRRSFNMNRKSVSSYLHEALTLAAASTPDINPGVLVARKYAVANPAIPDTTQES